MIILLLFLTSFTVSVSIIHYVVPIAVNIGLVDKPGDHKLHSGHIPLVGGIAIYLSLLVACSFISLLGLSSINIIILCSIGILFIIGLLDDRYSLSVKFRLSIQILASLLLVYENITLNDFGCIFSDNLFNTGIYSIPLTVIATVGVINSMNMIDGIDGLVGVESIVVLSLLFYASYESDIHSTSLIILSIIGSVCGFLSFNMRRKGFNIAKVFMGDAGSTILGFLIAYLLISMSQGEQRVIRPVVALWLFAVPLMDTLGVINRRLHQNRSPFHSDRCHLHHSLIDAGFRVRHAVYFIATIQLLLGTAGLTAQYLGISDRVSFTTFIILFISYIYLNNDYNRAVGIFRWIHRILGLTFRDTHYIYVSNLNYDNAVSVIEKLLGNTVHYLEYEILSRVDNNTQVNTVYGVIDVKDTDNIKCHIRNMKKRLSFLPNGNKIVIRQYVMRGLTIKYQKQNRENKRENISINERRNYNNTILYRSVTNAKKINSAESVV